MRKASILAGLSLIVTVVILFFSSSPSNPVAPIFTPTEAQAVSLNQFLKDNPTTSEVKEAYEFAIANEDLLSQVKCYCGCIQNQGHKSDYDCFLNEDGTFDLMGLNCGLCVKTALTTKQMLKDGKTISEISDYVNARWGKR